MCQEQKFYSGLLLIVSTNDLNQMVSELRLYGAVYIADGFVEHHLIELFDHLAGTEFSQISPAFAGWTLGVGLCQFGKLRAVFDFVL